MQEGYVLERFSSSADTFQPVRSFWAGKLIQELHLTEEQISSLKESAATFDHIDKPHLREALQCLNSCETSLSPRVHGLICGETAPLSLPPGLVGGASPMLESGTLNWTRVPHYLGEGAVEDKVDVDFVSSGTPLETWDLSRGAKGCSLLADHVQQQFSQDKELCTRIKNYFSWCPQPEVFLAVLEGQKELSGVQVNTTILLGTAALERALGDVLLSVVKGKHCPHLLKDLLAAKELEEVFSPIAMFLLRCLIGPPTGVNLRNVLWHGFADCKEVPCKFAVLLLVVVASLGRMLQERHTSDVVLKHRPFVTFPQEPLLCSTFRDLTAVDCGWLGEMFGGRSYFILPSMRSTWQAALQAFADKQYTVCLALLLPALEHSLRRVFACVNDCPERVITAEAG